MNEEDEAFEELTRKQWQRKQTSGWRKKQIEETSMTDKEAMKLALDALEFWDVHGKVDQPTEEAITALKERLAQPHETLLKEFYQFIQDDLNEHIWALKKRI
jgi:hypothetical protein